MEDLSDYSVKMSARNHNNLDSSEVRQSLEMESEILNMVENEEDKVETPVEHECPKNQVWDSDQ